MGRINDVLDARPSWQFGTSHLSPSDLVEGERHIHLRILAAKECQQPHIILLMLAYEIYCCLIHLAIFNFKHIVTICLFSISTSQFVTDFELFMYPKCRFRTHERAFMYPKCRFRTHEYQAIMTLSEVERHHYLLPKYQQKGA